MTTRKRDQAESVTSTARVNSCAAKTGVDIGISQSRQRSIALVDGDPSTFATAAVSDDSSLTLVYGFGGELVAIDELTITLPPQGDDVRVPNRVDRLVSNVSPRAGFQSVRTDPLQAATEPQKFSIRPSTAPPAANQRSAC